MFPHLDLTTNRSESLPCSAKDLGHGYALLRMCQTVPKQVTEPEAIAILRHWEDNNWPNMGAWPHAVMRWARLQLPNGQIAWSRWCEEHSKHPLQKTTCVKVCSSLLFYC